MSNIKISVQTWIGCTLIKHYTPVFTSSELYAHATSASATQMACNGRLLAVLHTCQTRQSVPAQPHPYRYTGCWHDWQVRARYVHG